MDNCQSDKTKKIEQKFVIWEVKNYVIRSKGRP